MKVIFDYQVFFLQRYGGISRYFYELARELSLLPDCSTSIIAPFNNNAYLKQHENEPFIYKPNAIVKKMFQDRSDAVRIKANSFLTARIKADILHETYYTHRFNHKSKKVITIHDMIYERLNSGKAGEDLIIEGKKKAIEQASAVIVVSEHTKKDLLHFYPSCECKTHVVHHGVSEIDRLEVNAYSGKRPFILFVGHRAGYKNFSTLLEAYALDRNLNQNFDLIAFGGDALSAKESSFIQKNNLENNVHFLKGDDGLLYSLYKSASAFVYNSSYEGFGMPVLEAMQMGCPVICSNTTSLPEVAGDAAILVSPSDVQQLVDALNELFSNDTLRQKKVSEGIERAKNFTWKKCAMETFTIYNNVLNG